MHSEEQDAADQAAITSTSRHMASGVVARAEAGVAGPGSEIPHKDALQASFGPAHDVSAIRAHVGGEAGTAARAIGAEAYATGQDVAFSGQPDLHTAAHEAAHVVQQQAGVHLAGGVGQEGDAHEREADAVADAVVAGESAAPMLARYAAHGDAREGAVQRKQVTAREPRAGSIELQRILENGDLDTVTKALRALGDARRKREDFQLTEDVLIHAGDDEYDLEVSTSVTDAMIPALAARKTALYSEPAADPAWQTFAEKFNKEFHSVLHAFNLDEKRDDTKKGAVSAERLQFLFTEGQRDKLTDYMATRMIPDRLFDGDEVGRLGAQQRILLASKILADGKYQPGSFVQEVHARFCFHWVRIVYQYAGVATENSTQGITGSFDVHGGVLLGDGKIEEPFHGKRDDSLDPSAEHLAKNPNAYRVASAPWSTVMDLQLGDWLYIYTENKTNSGGHSVVFAGWEGDEQTHDDNGTAKKWRLAATYDQGMPDQGGNRHIHRLGEDFFHLDSTKEGKEGPTVRPVTNIMRVDPDARPADSVRDLMPNLSKKLSAENQKFIDKKVKKASKDGPAMKFDEDAFLGWLRAENAELIAKIAATEGRLTPGQKALFEEANRNESDEVLVSLNQRLHTLAQNSDKLEEKTEAHQEAVDKDAAEGRAARDAAAAPLWEQVWAHLDEMLELEIEATPLRERIGEIDTSQERTDLRARQKVLKKELRTLDRQAKLGTLDEAGIAERARKQSELEDIEGMLAALSLIKKEFGGELKEVQRALDKIEKREKSLARKVDALLKKLKELAPETEYMTVNTQSSRGEVAKHGMNGRLDSIPVEVEWDRFIVRAE